MANKCHGISADQKAGGHLTMDAFEQFMLIFVCIAIVALPLLIGGSTIMFSNWLEAEREKLDKKS